MVFGLTEIQKAIMGYLYALKDTPQSPPDTRQSIKSIAKRQDITQKEVRKATKGLLKKDYIRHVIVERQRHYFITPCGIREIEKHLARARSGRSQNEYRYRICKR